MSTVAITTERLGKRYKLGAERQPYRTLRDTLTGAFRRSTRKGNPHVWALKDVSVEVGKGEVVGVIGKNGAGKSTLLKVLSRITEPTEGRAIVRGRVGSLLEVGTGFHNELTGRENIYLSGAILGMKRAEIRRKFDEMVAFAEVSKFIDTPLKHYSSGMYLRLAFGVAAHLEPSILLVDEVLAVGDLAFQRKCLGKMQEAGQHGQTVLFVSHDLTAISRLAPRTILLQDGGIRFSGRTEDALRLYAGQNHTSSDEDLTGRTDRLGDGLIRIESLRFFDQHGNALSSVGSGESITIVVGYTSALSSILYEDLALDMRFTDMLGHPIATFSTRFSSGAASGPLPGRGVLTCEIPSLSLAEETYGVDLWLAYKGGCADNMTRARELRVVAAPFFQFGQEPVKRKHGAALIRHEWSPRQDISRRPAAESRVLVS
jgi:lipopolysaccharide transport system ATP-binding protein